MAKLIHDSETPAHGQQVIVACAFIHKNVDGVEYVLMPKRAATKKFYPNVYEIPGGHIDFGEDIVDGLKREIREELGVEVSVGDPFSAFTYHNEVKGSHSIEVAYFAQLKDDESKIHLEPSDHTEWHWFSEDQYDEFTADRTDPDDPEPPVIMRGFALLRGQRLKV
jgi:8-oxo-dGTP diphosphatase